MNKILIFGKNGQVARALKEILGDRAEAISSEEVDFIDPANIETFLKDKNPSAIINAAAYTAVDKAEEEEQYAFAINAKAPEIIAKFCSKKNIPFIHYSTDYVFDGTGDKAWKPDDRTSPVNAYGRSKLAGEEAVKKTGGKYIIFRTSWVYDHSGKNFLTTMLRLGKEREELSVVYDQVGAPTYAGDIAKYTVEALAHDNFKSGIYHLCNDGETNWFEFACEIFKIAKDNGLDLKIKKINPITTDKYPTPAIRPFNSRLDCGSTNSILNIQMPDWKNALQRCMEKYFENN